MPVIEHLATINAPAEQIFAILDDPARLPDYMPGITNVSDVVQTDERVGDTAKFTYKVLGLSFDYTGTVTEWEKDRKFVSRMDQPIMAGTYSASVEPQGDAAEVTLRMDYDIKLGLLGRAINRIVLERMNDNTLRHGLENLKILVEKEVGAPA